MPACPECQTELTDDFGIVDCKSCGAVCSIDLDDNVTIQGEVEKLEVEEPQEEIEAESEVEEEAEAEAAEEGVEEPLEETSYEVIEETEPLEAEVYDDQVEEEPESEVEEASEIFEDSTELIPPPMQGADFLKDLEVFSEESSSEGLGHIYYDLHIAGLDDDDLREVFVETLADSRLEIDEESLREAVGESAVFTLPQVSFLRLTVIYKRLVTLGLELSWTLSEEQESMSLDPELEEEAGDLEEEY